MIERWLRKPLAEFVNLRTDEVTLQDGKEYRRVTVRLKSRGIEPRDQILGSQVKTKRQYRIRPNELLVAEIDAKAGGYGIVPPELDGAVVSGHYFTYEIDETRLDHRFLGLWLKTEDPLRQLQPFVRGALNYAAVRAYDFPKIEIPLPPLPEQQRIAGQLEHALRRLKEARQLHDSIEEEQREFLCAHARELADGAPRRPLREVAPLLRRPIEIKEDGVYPELGIRSFGRGTFHKPALTSEAVGTKRLFRIEPGDLLFSNVFSWEGAIAVSQKADTGRCGSHRFITCVPRPDMAAPEFLCFWFLGEEGMAQIRAASPGAAGRNRTLGLTKLAEMRVPVPPIEAQKAFTRLHDYIRSTATLHRDFIAETNALQATLLDQAFRGNLL